MENQPKKEQPKKQEMPQLISKSAVEFSRMQVPEISLPKGGGAIKGIEEKFQANPTTGSASFSIPVPTSPGRSGFGPSLSLSYDSGSGNSAFGLGWSLSLPSIVRKTEKGLPQYLDYENSDVFQFSGVEDLVPVSGSDDVEGDYQTRRYMPRVEGSFHRIERRTHSTTKISHWVVTSRDNVVTVYGDTVLSRIAHPNDATKVFRWMPHYSFDALGNVVVYEYKAEDLAGVSAANLCDRNRLGGLATQANLYLKRVLYGNTTPYNGGSLPTDYLFETVLDYGEHNLAIPTVQEDGNWTHRSDAFSSYRSGFEIRTRRLCKRVLQFHRFTELGSTACLVQSLDLSYSTNDAGFALLVSAVQSGHIRKVDDSYESKPLPAMEFTYSAHQWNESVRELDPESLENLPEGLSSSYQFTDLYGEGLSGILAEQGSAWYYKRNLGEGNFGPAVSVAPKPSIGSASAIQDLEGNNEKYLVDYTQVQGFAKLGSPDDLEQEGIWHSYQNFTSLPRLDWNSPTLKFIDLDGDGRADILIDEDQDFLYYRSEGKQGFSLAGKLAKELDEEKGPHVVFADAEQSIFMADMSGDGLTDIVRVRNGEICYWPNQGHGRFGAKVRMDSCPWMDEPDQFNPAFVRLADIDGSGPADLIYLGDGCVRAWLNRSGNDWSLEPIQLHAFPAVDRESRVQVLDFLGKGTACVVWSSSLPAHQSSPLRYVDLMGGSKPHLMVAYSNSLGKEVRLEYTPSTEYYLDDRAKGSPWVTKLPFVVHCLSAVETHEKITGHNYRTRYSYHHGYYDHVEREFRGFGRVDQIDADLYSDSDTDQLPVLTRTWFHVGATLQGKKILDHYAQEYNPDFHPGDLPEPELPAGLGWSERVEAIRACKGLALRQEIYELDASGHLTVPKPYQVVQKNCKITLKQARGTHKHAVFLVEDSESLTAHYEKNATDPRIQHTLVLQTNDYGQPEWTAAVVYGRQIEDQPDHVPDEIRSAQQKSHVAVSHTQYTAALVDGDGYRLPAPWVQTDYELHGLTVQGQLELQELWTVVRDAEEIPFEDADSAPNDPALRLVEHSEIIYRNDSAATALTPGVQGYRGLVWEHYALVHTQGLLKHLYEDSSNNQIEITDPMLQEAGYVQRTLHHIQWEALVEGDPDPDPLLPDENAWWAPSGKHLYPASPANAFFQPNAVQDAFGNQTSLEYDAYFLLLESVTDALGNTIESTNDYRTLTPVLMTDPNGNRTAVQTDALGIVVKSAVMGKTGGSEGDTLTDPTSYMEYGFADFNQEGVVVQPSWVHTYSRETHADSTTRWLEKVEYSDGLGRVQLTKAQAEPGPDQQPRWVGSGRTVLNNKGNPVKQYEPYFSSTDDWESETGFEGVTPVLHYDALSRMIRTDFPDDSYSKLEFTPWEQRDFDQNDTVLESLWYVERGSPNPAGSEPTDPEVRAAWLAAKHANTPTVTHLDSIGRPICVVTDDGYGQHAVTRTVLDIEGNEKAIFDARDNTVMEYRYGIYGEKCYTHSMDAGKRWMFLAIDGQPLYTWDARNHRLRAEFDELRRPTEQWLLEDYTQSGAEILVGLTEYGESATNPTASNLRGKPWKIYDQSGLTESVEFDFKGNLAEGKRQFATVYNATIDWNASPTLDSETFTTLTSFDALNRATSIKTPHNANIPASEILPSYNEASLLEQVEVKLRGAATATVFVSDIDYNAKGQRESIQYGSGATTSYTYDEQTFRLMRLLTTRNSGSEFLQDLNYNYDPVGNITQIRDNAQQDIYYNGSVVSPSQKFEYDALYRLIRATGREHIGSGSGTEPEDGVFPLAQSPLPSDATALRTYARDWEYDVVGNILEMVHQANNGNWARTYDYATVNNRLLSTTVGQTTLNYAHNVHGSMTSMPHLQTMGWDFAERLSHVTKGTTEAYYNYDASGQRVRKVVEKGSITETRLYLGGFEVYRKHVGSTLDTERETLHVMDDQKRIALVETKTWYGGTQVTSPVPLQRYQLDNHLGSASLELDESAAVISYEEYYPYGDTSYQSGRSSSEVSQKRYRYTGKEKDEESGLCYHGARYYACWLGRWTASDPIGVGDGVNLYMYVRGNPVGMVDPSGKASNQFKLYQPEQPATPQEDAVWSVDLSPKEGLPIIQMGVPGPEPVLSFGGFNFPTDAARAGFQDYFENRFYAEVVEPGGFDKPVPNPWFESGQDLLSPNNYIPFEQIEAARAEQFANSAGAWMAKNYRGVWNVARSFQGLPNDDTAFTLNRASAQSRAMIEEGSKELAIGAAIEIGTAGVGMALGPIIGQITRQSHMWEVGLYKNLRRVEKGLDAHHVGQKAQMRRFVKDFDPDYAPSILVPQEGHTQMGANGMVSRSMQGVDNARQLVARDILDLRRVYEGIPNSSLQQLIEMNKTMYPGAFIK